MTQCREMTSLSRRALLVTGGAMVTRAMGAMPSGDRVPVKGGLAVGPSTALIMRGSVPVLGWAPQVLATASDDLAARVMDLYAQRDPVLKAALAKGLETERMASREG